ncbi:MAG: tail fiber protein, partial [Bacteroidota bacterium]
MSPLFLGQIIPWPSLEIPDGWMPCEGQIISIGQNTALFSLLGTVYGGDGRTSFALPDLRGRMPIGYGTGPGLSAKPLGEPGGVEYVTLTEAQ